MILVDAGLRSFAGHHAAYAQSVALGARQRGLSFRVAGPQSHDPALCHLFQLDPTFHRDDNHRPSSLPGEQALRNLWQFRSDAKQLSQRLTSEPTLVLIDNTDHHDLLRWAASLHLFPDGPSLTWVFMLRRVYYDCDQACWPHGTRHLKMALRLLSWHGKHRNIHLASDSDRLINQYHQLTKAPIHLLPIPHTHGAIADPVVADNASLHFVFLGDARAEKGLANLVEAIAQLKTHPAGRNLRFTLQTHQASGRDSEVDQALTALRSRHHPDVTFLEHTLAAPEYQRLIQKADAILCPYARARYQTTSGPFTEALAAGKPVLVTADTWMSDQLRKYGAGIVCDNNDPESITKALLLLQQQYPELARQAADSQKAWMEIHNPQNFIDTLIRATEAKR